jgi:hypothetical protein
MRFDWSVTVAMEKRLNKLASQMSGDNLERTLRTLGTPECTREPAFVCGSARPTRQVWLPNAGLLCERSRRTGRSTFERQGRVTVGAFRCWCQQEPTAGEERSPATNRPGGKVETAAVGAGAASLVKVRFINTPGGLELETMAPPGSIVLAVADELGLRIPRGCTSGVCGACTCDMVHPSLPGGRQTVRVCSTKVATFPGIDEIVIDVYRMKESATRDAYQSSTLRALNRFDNIDFEYKAGAQPRAIMNPANPFARPRTVRCEKCKGTGKHVCEACEGTGKSTATLMCYVCVGLRRTRCAECQGTGSRTLRR